MLKLATSRLSVHQGFIIPSFSLPPLAPSLSFICNTSNRSPGSLSFPTPTPPIPKFWGLSVRCVHVGGSEIPNNKRVEYSLQWIHGIGRSRARQILCDLNMVNKVTKDLSQDEVISLREEVSKYLIDFQLKRSDELAIKRLKDIQCYRGIRHIQGLPCRGQRTKTNARICQELNHRKLDSVDGRNMARR